MKGIFYVTDSFLHRLNPLSKILVFFPILFLIALTTDIWTPLAFFVLVTLMILGLGKIPLLYFLRIAFTPLLFLGIFTLMYPFFVRPELASDPALSVHIGPITYHTGALAHVLQTTIRAYAIIVLSISFTLTTDASDFIRAMVQQWKFPYKLGYGAMAAFRFVPMLRTEMHLIQSAHKIRGIADTGGLRYARIRRFAVPLLGIAIRRAERTALAMDSRAFGAYRTRTYFKRFCFSARDYLFLLGSWIVSLLLLEILWYCGLLGTLSFVKPL